MRTAQFALLTFWDVVFKTFFRALFLFNNTLILYLHHFNDCKYFILWMYCMFKKLTNSLLFGYLGFQIVHYFKQSFKENPKPINKINS